MNHTLSQPLLSFCHSENHHQLATFLDQFSNHDKETIQKNAELLSRRLNALPHLAGHVFLNLPVPHSSECTASVILYRGLIFVISIDHAAQEHCPTLMAKTHQFATQFKQHHDPSKDKFIIPIVLTPNAQPQGSAIHVSEDLVANTMCDTGEHLAAMIEHFSNQYKDDEIAVDAWRNI